MNEWIKVEDQLPEPFVDILAVNISHDTDSYEKGEVYLSIDKWVIWQDGSEPSFRAPKFHYGEVTHWMPLPELPKDDKI